MMNPHQRKFITENAMNMSVPQLGAAIKAHPETVRKYFVRKGIEYMKLSPGPSAPPKTKVNKYDDPNVKIVRPPAIYNNLASPYQIASSLKQAI